MLVGTLLTLLTLGVLQLGLSIYVRNVVHDAAVEGAFHAALADTSLERRRRAHRRDHRAHRRRRVRGRHRRCARRAHSATPPSRSRVRATLPLVGLLGAPRAMEVTAHAPVESFD